jgi:hypothetical protein
MYRVDYPGTVLVLRVLYYCTYVATSQTVQYSMI